MTDPQGYWNAVGAAYSPTDVAKNLVAAGYRPGTPEYQQQMQAYLRSQTYKAPINGRPGSIIRDPYDPTKIIGYNPSSPVPGAVPQFDGGGNVTGWTMPDGATNLIAATAGAKKAGENANEPIEGVDANGNPVFSNKLAAARGGAGVPGGFRPGLAPGTSKFLDGLGTSGAQYYADLQTASKTANQQIYSLREISRLASGTTQFGPGSEAAISTAKVLNSIGQAFGVGGSWNDKNVTDMQVMSKFANNVAGAAAASMGLNGSDARFNVATQSNPGGHMTNNAIRDVVPYVVGLRQAEVGLANFAGRYAQQHPGPNYQAEVQSQWNKAYDPRIFTLMERGPQAFSSYVRSLPKAQAADLRSKYLALKQMGALPQ